LIRNVADAVVPAATCSVYEPGLSLCSKAAELACARPLTAKKAFVRRTDSFTRAAAESRMRTVV